MQKTVVLVFILSFIFFGCKRYVVIETDDYKLKLPQEAMIFPDDDQHKIEQNSNSLFSVMVYKKNIGDFYDLDDCLTKQMVLMLEGPNTYNIKSSKRKINGLEAVISRGVNFVDGKKIYWLIAIYKTKYYYYILRIFSGEKILTFNEFEMEKIANSFKVKKANIF